MAYRISPRLSIVSLAVSLAFSTPAKSTSDAIEFNTDVLDVQDRNNINLSQFSQAGYIMPGIYPMLVYVNKQNLPEQDITIIEIDDASKQSMVCLQPDLVAKIGLKDNLMSSLKWLNDGQCLNISSLKGMVARSDLGANALYLSIPQEYLEFSAPNWDPPSRWDNGIPGFLFDYNLNGDVTRQSQGNDTRNLSGNGTAGANVGAWRLRADWQARYANGNSSTGSTARSWDWNRYYAFRALTSLRAKLTMGEDYLNSGMFDSFRFTGTSLVSDDNMLPPNLRGYAPEVSGVAKSNAKVTISQQGRVIYETQVAAGPYRIQDLSNSVSGKLDVTVKEEDGSIQSFQVDTANIPYLTRPGSVRYKLSAGKPTDYEHHSQGPVFGAGEFSWGVSNGWSLYAGALSGGNYNALSLGVGRDLLRLGAISFDVTQSRAQLPEQGSLQGGSYRLSYSKRFEEYDSQVTFAGYRFSQRDFMNMSDYLQARYHQSDNNNGSSKELYTITFNKQFRDLGLSAYLNYSHQTYWNKSESNRYNLSLSRYFDIGSFKNMSINLSGYRSQYNNTNDDGMYLGLSIPWGGNSGTLSYSAQMANGGNSQSIGYSDQIDSNNTYQFQTGTTTTGRSTASGYYTHEGDITQVTASASYNASQSTSAALSLRGGATITANGAALHRTNSSGGGRLMLDTDGVSGIPIMGNGSVTHSNYFGKAVVADVGSYYRSSANIDLDNLADNVEATRSVAEATLTEGAIGYRRFNIISGEKIMAIIRLADGSMPPFGATVLNADNRETGVVNDAGSVYLTGIQPEAEMRVRWDGKDQCRLSLPKKVTADNSGSLLLPCTLLTTTSQTRHSISSAENNEK